MTLGGWLTPCHLFGIEGSYLGIGTQTARLQRAEQRLSHPCPALL